MFSHKMRSGHVLQRECFAARLYHKGHHIQRIYIAMYSKKMYMRIYSVVDKAHIGAFIDVLPVQRSS